MSFTIQIGKRYIRRNNTLSGVIVPIDGIESQFTDGTYRYNCYGINVDSITNTDLIKEFTLVTQTSCWLKNTTEDFECPEELKNSMIIMQFRNGSETLEPVIANLFDWSLEDSPDDIVAYQVVINATITQDRFVFDKDTGQYLRLAYLMPVNEEFKAYAAYRTPSDASFVKCITLKD